MNIEPATLPPRGMTVAPAGGARLSGRRVQSEPAALSNGSAAAAEPVELIAPGSASIIEYPFWQTSLGDRGRPTEPESADALPEGGPRAAAHEGQIGARHGLIAAPGRPHARPGALHPAGGDWAAGVSKCALMLGGSARFVSASVAPVALHEEQHRTGVFRGQRKSFRRSENLSGAENGYG